MSVGVLVTLACDACGREDIAYPDEMLCWRCKPRPPLAVDQWVVRVRPVRADLREAWRSIVGQVRWVSADGKQVDVRWERRGRVVEHEMRLDDRDVAPVQGPLGEYGGDWWVCGASPEDARSPHAD